MVKVYVYVLGEALHTWAPANAEHVAGNVYRILDDPPKNVAWEFKNGDLVRCHIKMLAQDVEPTETLTALELAVDTPLG